MTKDNEINNNLDDLIEESISQIDEDEKKDFLDLEANEVFLDFRLKRKLGRNSFSASFIIEQESEERILKIIKSSLYKSYEDFYKPLVDYQNKETSNKYQIYDFGKYEDCYYLVSSYVEGRSLRKILENKKEQGQLFRLKHAYGIIVQVLQELTFSQGEVPHTLINPSTVIISRDGNVSLVEFGIYQNLTPSKRFKVFSELGFADFMAPEAASERNEPIVSDIYSIGIMLYWLLTGETLQQYFEIPVTGSEDMTNKLRELIENCTNPDPNLRVRDIKLLQLKLTSLISEKPVNVASVKKFKETPPQTPPKAPPKKVPPMPKQFTPPAFKPASIKETKLNLPNKKVLDEFEKFKTKKGDVTLGELDDVERWFFVKDGVDFGPVSAKKIRELVEAKELPVDTIIKTLTHPVKRGRINELELFRNFVKDFELRQSEEEMIKKMASSKRKNLIITLLIVLVVLSGGIFWYIQSNKPKPKKYVHVETKKEDEGVELIVQETGGIKSDDFENDKNKDKDKKTTGKKKKRRRKYYKKKRVRNKKTGKMETVMVEVDPEEEMKKAFEENEKENKDVASISFKGKNGGKKLTNEEIKAKISTIKRDVISCFEQEYNRTEYLPSRLKISYNIRQNGKIYNVTIQHPRYKHKKGKLNYCVLKAFRKIKFHSFAGGTKVGVMPLEFEME